MSQSQTRALVLFSGGQDSTTCLAWALHNYDYVETVGFNYGQRHVAELECRTNILGRLRNEYCYSEEKLGQDHMLDFQTLYQISDTALTSGAEIKMTERGLPSTFVPGRNLLFFTLASAIAYRRGFSAVIGGMCETDFSGYPDCRRDVLNDLQAAVSGGMDYPIEFVTPLMYKTKAETWKLAFDLEGGDFIELIKNDTHTCYKGDRSALHLWGYGCGECPACLIRKEGYEQYIAASNSK